MRDDAFAYDVRPGASPDIRIMELHGPLTLRNMFEFQKTLSAGTERVTIIDLSGTPYMDSAGLGALLNFHVHAQRNGRSLRLAGVNQRVNDLFDVTRVRSVVSAYPDVAAAEAAG